MILFIILKLTKVIGLSWWWIFAALVASATRPSGSSTVSRHATGAVFARPQEEHAASTTAIARLFIFCFLSSAFFSFVFLLL